MALWQAGWVKERLESAGHAVEIKVIKTSGDHLTRAPLVQSGIKGLFIKEIEEALADGAIDLAVHSLKDLPAEQAPDFHLAAFPKREDPRDVLISRDGRGLHGLPPGARVSTSSVRRQSQLQSLRKDLCLLPIRGNVDTRVRKLHEGECDGIVVAAAGVRRLGLESLIAQYFSPEEICPAVGQGALAVEVRRNDDSAKAAVEPLDDLETRRAVTAERTALRLLGGGCQTPIAVYARIEGAVLKMSGVVATPDGSRVFRSATEGPADDGEAVARRLAAELLRQSLLPFGGTRKP